MGDDMHLLMLLFGNGKPAPSREREKKARRRVDEDDVQDERVALWFLHRVEWGDHTYEDDKGAHGRNILERVDEGGIAVRGGAVQGPRGGEPQAVADRETIKGGRERDGVVLRGCLARAVSVSTVHGGERESRGRCTFVCAQVECAGSVDAQ